MLPTLRMDIHGLHLHGHDAHHLYDGYHQNDYAHDVRRSKTLVNY